MSEQMSAERAVSVTISEEAGSTIASLLLRLSESRVIILQKDARIQELEELLSFARAERESGHEISE